MAWTLKNKETGELIKDSKQSFEDLCKTLNGEVDKFVNDALCEDDIKIVKIKLAELKEFYQKLEFHNYNVYSQENPSVWDYLRPKLIREYIAFRYDANTVHVYTRLMARMGDVLKDSFVVGINGGIHHNLLSELGLIYVVATVYDPNMHPGLIVLSQEQYNYLRLVYPENITWHVTDINALTKDLGNMGLL